MMEVKGQYNTAIVFAENLDKKTIGQLIALCNQEFSAGSKLRVMPDAHAGKGCVIGTTMSVTSKIVPNLVGVDIGCGLEVIEIGHEPVNFQQLDNVIRRSVPSGHKARSTPHHMAEEIDLSKLSCAKAVNMDKALHSIGTLGGGNHFIEVAKDDAGSHYLLIHSGSRQAGLQVAIEHQKIAGEKRPEDVPYELAYLEGENFADYVQDMQIMQRYADLNRKAIAAEILKGMKWKAKDSFTTVHNYLDTEAMILRKGAVSAKKDERLVIPLNMRDGSLICKGLGNADWNCSAPHGAGRAYSRTDARNSLTLTQFKQDMEGIYSTCVSRKTIDESPRAYKPMEDILQQVKPTAEVLLVVKPVYNFKVGE